MDEDRDGRVSESDWAGAIAKESLLLETFGQCIPSARVKFMIMGLFFDWNELYSIYSFSFQGIERFMNLAVNQDGTDCVTLTGHHKEESLLSKGKHIFKLFYKLIYYNYYSLAMKNKVKKNKAVPVPLLKKVTV